MHIFNILKHYGNMVKHVLIYKNHVKTCLNMFTHVFVVNICYGQTVLETRLCNDNELVSEDMDLFNKRNMIAPDCQTL